jgi:hypothetical protein
MPIVTAEVELSEFSTQDLEEELDCRCGSGSVSQQLNTFRDALIMNDIRKAKNILENLVYQKTGKIISISEISGG